ncbi:hypothetical protein PNI0197_00634 [Streptococcus pneumoniae PNI0197]|nr:hypothetical protein PNI0197_00634 [Streptococcus pneumoniae PNI0197]
MEIKEQTRKLAAGCSKHCFEVVDETDEGIRLTKSAQKLGFEVVDETDGSFEVVDRTDEVTIYGKATLTWCLKRFSRALYFKRPK